MFCGHCGSVLVDGGRFCSRCGKPHDLPVSAQSANPSLLLTVRPRYCWFLSLYASIIAGCILYFIVLSIVMPFIAETKSEHFSPGSVCLGLTIIPLATIILGMVLAPRAYACTVYRFYADRIEYTEYFINEIHQVMRYTDLSDVDFTQNTLQRCYGVGSVTIAVRVPIATSRISMDNIPAPAMVYEDVRKLIGQSR